MNASERSQTPPTENTTPPVQPPAGADQWILMSLNNLRDDIKAVKASVDGVSDRLGKVENKITRATYTLTGAIGLAALIWSGYQVVTHFVDIKFVPKADQTN